MNLAANKAGGCEGCNERCATADDTASYRSAASRDADSRDSNRALSAMRCVADRHLVASTLSPHSHRSIEDCWCGRCAVSASHATHPLAFSPLPRLPAVVLRPSSSSSSPPHPRMVHPSHASHPLSSPSLLLLTPLSPLSLSPLFSSSSTSSRRWWVRWWWWS